MKSLSRLGIAGSPRNSFRASGLISLSGGRATDELVKAERSARSSNSECHLKQKSSQSMGDKLHGQKGNNPDYQLRSLNSG